MGGFFKVFQAKFDPREIRFYPPPPFSPNMVESSINYQIGSVYTYKGDPDILLIGDSSCMFGLIPMDVNRMTGLDCLNIATVGYLGVQGQVDLLEYYLKLHKAPKLVLCQFGFPTLERTTARIKDYGWYDKVKRWLPGWNDSFAARTFQYHNAIRWKAFWSFRKTLLSKGMTDGFTLKEDGFAVQLELNKGYMPNPPKEALHQLAPEEIPTLKITSNSIEALKALDAVAAKYGIRVVFYMNPMPESARSNEFISRLDSWDEQLRSACSGLKHLYIPEKSRLLRFYPVSICPTFRHITTPAAERNTEEAVMIIQQRLGTTP